MGTLAKKSSYYINKVIAYAKTKLDAKEAALFSKFLKVYYSNLSIEDLAAKTPVDLSQIAWSHYQLLREQTPNKTELKVFNPEKKKNKWSSTHTIIQIVTKDMPFLVDSIQMAANRLGLTIHLVINSGTIMLERDDDNELIDISSHLNCKEKHTHAVALIYLEVDRRTDKQKLSEIHREICSVIKDARAAVTDWPKMRKKVEGIIDDIQSNKALLKMSDASESVAFLHWLVSNHFTFLGYREYRVEGTGAKQALKLVPKSGLGVLANEKSSKKIRYYKELPEAARKLALSKKHVLIISKTNTRSSVHRRAYTDYVGVKIFDKNGNVTGEKRFIGLYTSSAYSESPTTIPFIREKVDYVMRQSGFSSKGHTGKRLMHILSSLPRDDLFHSSASQLFDLSIGILQLQERRKVKLFVRQDNYGRYASCFVFLPRENFNTDLVQTMQRILRTAYGAREAVTSTRFSDSVLARIHYLIRLDPKHPVKPNLEKLQKQLVNAARSWKDVLRERAHEYFGEEKANVLLERYWYAFPAGYREAFSARQAVFDIENIEQLTADKTLQMTFYRTSETNELHFKLFRVDEPVPLFEAVPMLENMGLKVMREQPYQIKFHDGKTVWINDFAMDYEGGAQLKMDEVQSAFQEGFYHIWNGDSDNDGFNRLILAAELNWRQVNMLRAYAHYFRQVGSTYSRNYIEKTLAKNLKITKLLVALFDAKFNPEYTDHQKQVASISHGIMKLLGAVRILDEDKIYRLFLNCINATLRTNFFQLDQQGGVPSYLVFKFNPAAIPNLPLPLPKYEVYVYSPRFEGVHLRASKVARGGIRWSDRPEDFRTEVLGLMKAQQVKNAVIVPAGAKGGFVPKKLPVGQGREAVIEEAVNSYVSFISGLLDITDNIKNKKIVRPKLTVCYDEDDPYLVVAADKGTATFSDIANGLAVERGFWLADAFASGGSTGYDHKKMGITARGAWVSAERHFQELGVNLSKTEVTAVGIGDMSGDVFGNGMLLSKHLKLVAAFNHMHIFIDPDPDPAVSFAERKRLFNLPRSTWADYEKSLISRGGGVYLRAMKEIKLSARARKLFGITSATVEPNELIRAILRAPVDLLWNGGIGTYVKASSELNIEAGDRTNDAVRVNGCELQAKVVCEGGNLGLTQLGRIEYALTGGRLNTDFIDNSAGVDCSDHEVNIKILLNHIVATKKLTESERNKLLSAMTNDVAKDVLINNYVQNQAISISEMFSAEQVDLYISYIDDLQKEGKINRELEFLPSSEQLQERKVNGVGLTRPELSILFSYSKIVLKQAILQLGVEKDPYLSDYIKFAFPDRLQEAYPKQINNHYLRNEIIATQLCNRLLADMGLMFIYQMQLETDASIIEIVKAYAAVTNIFHMSDIIAEIDQLDYQLDAKVQYEMLSEAMSTIRKATLWLLRNRPKGIDIKETVDKFSGPVEFLFNRLPKLLMGSDKERISNMAAQLIEKGVPIEVAEKIAAAKPTFHALNIIEAADKSRGDLHKVAKVYFMLINRLDMLWFREQLVNYKAENRWTIMAKASLKSDMDLIQRELTLSVLRLRGKVRSSMGLVNAWVEKHRELVERSQHTISELRSDPNNFDLISVAVRQLLVLVSESKRR